MISIVSVYNKERVLKDVLLKSLENQTTDFELIQINNTQNKFKSAAEALNYGGKNAKDRYIMFVHQDVYLLANDWLERAENLLNKIPYLGIAGVAGMRETGKSSMERAISMVYDEGPWGGYKNFDMTLEVQTLDGQMLIVPQKSYHCLYGINQ